MPRVMRRGFLPSASITQIAGAPPVFARQNAMYLPSGDSLARKSQTGGSLCVRTVTRPSRGSSRQISVPPRASSGLKSRLKWSTSGRFGWNSQGTLDPGKRRGKRMRAVAGPCGHVRTASSCLRIAVSRREPHRLAAREHPVFAAIGSPDADVGPVVTRVFAGLAIDVKDPAAVRRPARAEVEVTRLRGDADAVRTVGVARPDLVTLRTREVECDPLTVGAQAQAIGESLAGARELAWVGPVEANAEDLADILAHHLHEEPVGLTQQEGRRLERCQSILGADLLQGTGLKVVNPDDASGSACNTR